MKPNCLLLWSFCVLLVGFGCNGLSAVPPKIEVEIVNQSSHALEEALARFGDYNCEWGHVGKTFAKSYLSYPHPITAQTELRWDEEGKHRVEKLDLSKIYAPGKSGRLTFSVRDDRVEVRFREASSAK